jgi:hypothetical protein
VKARKWLIDVAIVCPTTTAPTTPPPLPPPPPPPPPPPATAVVEGEAMVVTSTLGRVVVTTSLSRTQWMQTQSVAKLGLLPSTCVPVFDVVTG